MQAIALHVLLLAFAVFSTSGPVAASPDQDCKNGRAEVRVRGFELSRDDSARAYVINRLMCDLNFSAESVRARFPDHAEVLVETAKDVLETDADDLVEKTPDGFHVTDRGRPFIRSICAYFDAYLGEGQALHSSGV